MKFEPSDFDALRPVIVETIREMLEQIDAERARLVGNRLAYGEAEAAGLLGLNRHQLRDCRLRGEVKGVKIGKAILYKREDLELLLRRNQLT